MTALIDPTRRAAPRHRRIVEDSTDEVGVPVVDGWLDPETAPLAVYHDRDLPYAPPAVQRDRARVAAVVPSVPAPPVGPTPPHPTQPSGTAVPESSHRRVPTAPRVLRVRAAVLVAVAVLVVLVGVVTMSAAGPPSSPGGGPAGASAVHSRPLGR